MQVLSVLPQAVSFVVSYVDKLPEDKDVKAGWTAFAIFIGLILAVVFLGYSLVKQLRKVDAAEDAGLYDPTDKKPVAMLPQDSARRSGAERPSE
jgi:hypothetical protein